MNSFLFDYRRVVYFSFCCCILHCFPWLLALVWMRFLRIERHLAAKFGTFSAFLYERSSLLWMNDILRWWFSCSFFFNKCYFHHTEMISFIKFFPVIRFFLLQRRLSEVLCLCCLIKLLLNFKSFD